MYSTLSNLSNDQFIMLKLFNKDCLINNIYSVKILKKDSRWESLTLEKGEREKLFAEHIDRLVQKKKDAFRSLLEELKDTPLDASFKVLGWIFSEKLPPIP